MGIHFDQTSPTKSCHGGTQVRLLTQANEGAVAEVSEASKSYLYTYYHSFPHICLLFCNLSAIESSGGGGVYMRDLTVYLANTPPFLGPRLDVDVGYYITNSTTICLHFSCPPETRWSRSTDRGWPQRRWRHFPSTPRVCPFNVLYCIDATRGHTCNRLLANSFAGLWTLIGFVLGLPFHHRDLELDTV